jgi:uncharacterized repeat protein (TIGR01451 family)
MLPLDGSLALRHGDYGLARTFGVSTDQRGYTFAPGRVDIGAAERQYDLTFQSGHVEHYPDHTIVYSVTVSNLGPDPAPSAQVIAPIPDGLEVESTSAAPGWTEADYQNPSSVVFTHPGDLDHGASATFTITCRPVNMPDDAVVSSRF